MPKRSLAAALVAVLLGLMPALGGLPGSVAQAATIPVVCTGTNDASLLINPAIATASDGDVIQFSAPNGYCDIDVTVLVTHAVTLTSASAPTKVAFKGRELTAVSAFVTDARAAINARNSATWQKAGSIKADLAAGASSQAARAQAARAQATTTGGGTGTAGSGAPRARGAGTGGGFGHQAGASDRDGGRQGVSGSTNRSLTPSAIAQRFWSSALSHSQSGGVGASSATTGPGLAVFPSLPPVTIQYLIITGFNNSGVDDAGGAIIVGSNTQVTIQNNEIRQNAAARGGGIALIENNDNSIIRNNVIQNNLATCFNLVCGDDGSDAQAGGGIFTYFDVDNLEISNNTIDSNIAIRSGGGVRIGYDSGDLKFLANTCTSNISDESGGCLRQGGGGNRGEGNGPRAMFVGNQFVGNNASSNGGAVRTGDGNAGPTFADNRFDSNISSASGGAVLIGDRAQQVSFTTNQFTGNAADNRGGALFLGDVSSTCGTPSTIASNSFSGNASGRDAGAIHVDPGAHCTTLRANSFNGNGTGGAGGAVVFGGGEGGENINVVIDGDQYTGNGAGLFPAYFAPSGLGGGGAVKFGARMTGLQIKNNAKFTGNTAGNNGGALDFSSCGTCAFSNENVVEPSAHVRITNVQFTNNATTGQFAFNPFCGLSCPGVITGQGGAIFFGHEMDDLILDGVQFTENRTAFSPGGAIAFSVLVPEVVPESTAAARRASAASGRVTTKAFTTDTGVTFRDTQFLRNSATNGIGGGLFILHDIENLVLDGTLFDGNKAASGGGAIMQEGYLSNPLITRSTFTNNTTTDVAIVAGAGAGASQIFGSNEGGALYLDGPSDNLRITGRTVFRGNSSTSNDGGAISIGGNSGGSACAVNARIDTATFDTNKAGGSGGAIALKSSCSTNFRLEHSTLTGNTANGIGGALLLTNDSFTTNTLGSQGVSIDHNTFGTNSSASRIFAPAIGGGAVAVYGASPGLRFYDNVLHHSTAAAQGGTFALFCSSCSSGDLGSPADMQVYNNTFANGTAPVLGGVYIETQDSSSAPTSDAVAFWNNIAYLNLSGDLGSTSTVLTAWNSVIGSTVAPAVCTGATSCITNNPQFANAAGSDYHLLPTSPAINLGATVNPTSVGSLQASPTDDRDDVLRTAGPDAGAYENPQGSPATPGTPGPTGTPTETPTPGEPTTTSTPCVPSRTNPVGCATPTLVGTATSTPTQDTTPGRVAQTLTPTLTLTPFGAATSPTPTATNSPVVTASVLPSSTPTQTATPTLTSTATRTPTITLTPSCVNTRIGCITPVP